MDTTAEKSLQYWSEMGKPCQLLCGCALWFFAAAFILLGLRTVTGVLLVILGFHQLLLYMSDAKLLSLPVINEDPTPTTPHPLPMPERYPRTLGSTSSFEPPPPTAPTAPNAPTTTTTAARNAQNMGDARSFWDDEVQKGLQGKRVAPYQCGRNYAHYIPGSMT